MSDPIVVPGLAVPIPNPFDPSAPLFTPPATPGGGASPIPPAVTPQADAAGLVAIAQTYDVLSPDAQAKVYEGVKSNGGGKDAYAKDWLRCAAIGAVAGLVVGYVVLGHLTRSMR